MFEGFRPETFDFLWGLRFQNEREWFEAHKKEYINYLYDPMKALAREVYAGFEDAPAMEMKVSRIYRDARLHPPVPYKEGLWFVIRHNVQEWSRHPTLFFEIRPEGAKFGFLLWQPRASVMEAFRKDLEVRPDYFPEIMKQAEKESGLIMKAQSYQRPKICPIPDMDSCYQWRCSIQAAQFLEPGPELFSNDLSETVEKTLHPLVPVCDYFYNLTEG